MKCKTTGLFEESSASCFFSSGFHVDESICPGFRYRVRYMGSKDFLFDGEPRMLQSIGLGYGKRLTFSGETLNNNENYFWSDSRPEGYAFTVSAVEAGDKFVIYDEMSRVVGDVDIIEVDERQTEEKTVYEPDYTSQRSSACVLPPTSSTIYTTVC